MKHAKFRRSPLDDDKHIQVVARHNIEAYERMPFKHLVAALPSLITTFNCWLHQTDTKILGLCSGNKTSLRHWASRADRILCHVHKLERLASQDKPPRKEIIAELATIEAYRAGVNSTLAINGVL